MSITTSVNNDHVNIANHDDEDEQDEYYYHLLKSKITAAQNVVVTDVTVNNSTITFKVFNVNFIWLNQFHVSYFQEGPSEDFFSITENEKTWTSTLKLKRQLCYQYHVNKYHNSCNKYRMQNEIHTDTYYSRNFKPL